MKTRVERYIIAHNAEEACRLFGQYSERNPGNAFVHLTAEEAETQRRRVRELLFRGGKLKLPKWWEDAEVCHIVVTCESVDCSKFSGGQTNADPQSKNT